MAQPKVLADRLIAGEGILWDAGRLAAANLLMVLCAWIALPLRWTPVPVTGQTFGVLLVGAAGLPVFQPFGAPGAARLLGPTAGYLWAYPVCAFLTGWLVERGARNSTLRLVGALLPGQALVFAAGCAWLALMPFLHPDGTFAAMGWSRAFAAGVLPFLPGEVLKIALVVAAVRGVEVASKKG